MKTYISALAALFMVSACTPETPTPMTEDMRADTTAPISDMAPDTSAPVDMATPEADMSAPTPDTTPDLPTPTPDMTPDMPAPVDMTPDMPPGPAAPLPTDVRNHIFGHSLILHQDDANVPMWLHALAAEAGYTYGMSGQYGFADTHANNLPPFPQWGVSGVTGAWDSDTGDRFEDIDFNTILFTEANFRQYFPPTERDPDNILPESSVASTIKVFDWVESREPGARFVIYENWPDMGGRTTADFSSTFPSAAELAAYHSFTSGDFHRWWVDYQDGLRAARPDLEIHMIPVGSVMANLLTGVLSDVPASALYEDDAPHGLPTLYFLAGLITYMGLYGVEAPMTYTPPGHIHEFVRARYPQLVQTIWAELSGFQDASGANRVWGR